MAPLESPKLQTLYDDITKLTVLETVQLVAALKEKFGYVEPTVVASAGPAAGAAPAAAAAAPEPAKVVEKTEFTLRLDKFNPTEKVKVIKIVKTITELGLVAAKALVESAPNAIIKKDISKADAENFAKQIKEAGGECVLE